MTTEKLTELRRLAEAATRGLGPWKHKCFNNLLILDLLDTLDISIKLTRDLIESHEGVYHEAFWESEIGKRAREFIASLEGGK